MPGWVTAGWDTYAVRMPRECRLQLQEIPLKKRGRGIDDEGERMVAAVGRNDHVVAMDVAGSSWSTPQLARQLGRWMQQGGDVCFLVGGPDGLAESARQRASQSWSLSKLTFPHSLVRIMVAEQLYRAWSILSNHPYHRN